MAQKTIQGSEALGKKIKLRRTELGLTIEEAATKAGVGTKTWCRYESGESIRSDKGKGICKALNWRSLPDEEDYDNDFSLEEYRDHEAWSSYLEQCFGVGAALSFAIGSDIIYDYIRQDIEELSSMPKGSHIGELGVSWMIDALPKQFLPEYDYDFLYQLKCCLQGLIGRAHAEKDLHGHSVMEELLIYLCNQEGISFLELSGELMTIEDEMEDTDLEEWVFDLFDDMDIITYLYSNCYLPSNHVYHFSHWSEDRFYRESR